jgi:DNA-binding FadR family transcriptional regulator
MTADWEPVRQPRTHELVLDRVEQQVLTGKLRAGDRLPPERQLATALGVSRAALREALRILEAFGVLVAQTGRGPGAGATVTAEPTDAVGRLLRLHLALGGYRVGDILSARIMLERSSVAEAAERAGAGALEEAAALLEAMGDPQLAPVDYNELDTRFHVELARCSGNELTCTLTAAVRESIRPLLLDALEAVTDWHATVARLNAQHSDILRLIRRGAPEKAAQAVEEHIRDFHGRLTGESG